MNSKRRDVITPGAFERELLALRTPGTDPCTGLFGPDTALWQMGRQTLSLLGAGRATLLQLAHPWVAQAIHDHSRTRRAPLDRLRGTFSFVLTMVFGSVDQALNAARTVHGIHAHIAGALPPEAGGNHYSANRVSAMAWVHATLAETTIYMQELVHGPVDEAYKTRYYAESKRFARLFGIPSEALPPDWSAFMDYNRRMWASDELRVGGSARELADFLFQVRGVPGPVMRRFRLFTALIMPPPLAVAFDLPADTPDARRRFERWVRLLRAAWPRLPARLRYMPTYYEALGRLEGRTRPDPLTALGNRLLLGRYRIVS